MRRVGLAPKVLRKTPSKSEAPKDIRLHAISGIFSFNHLQLCSQRRNNHDPFPSRRPNWLGGPPLLWSFRLHGAPGCSPRLRRLPRTLQKLGLGDDR